MFILLQIFFTVSSCVIVKWTSICDIYVCAFIYLFLTSFKEKVNI